jgi:Xaa-Pro aminopeptidase
MTPVPGPDTRPRPLVSPFAFPAEEYEHRVARARQAMDEAGLDALLLSDDRNFFYVTGAGGATPREDKARPQFVLVPLVGEVAVLISHARAVPFRESSWVAELHTYDSLGTDVVRTALANFVRRTIPRAKTLGFELGYEQRLGMPVADYLALQAQFPECKFVDASRVLWRLRMVKSASELARIERAIQITDQAFAAVLPTLRPGLTEREIAGRLQAEMGARGASTSWVLIQSGTYDRGGLIARDRPVQAGEMVWVDMGANVLGYWADFCRAAVLGPPTAHQRRIQTHIREITQMGIETVRPGITVADVARVCAREMGRRGLPFNTWGVRYGHGLGLQTTEPPHVAEYDDTVIEPGMTLTLEPGTCTAEGRFQIEENLTVTASGARCLSQSPRDLIENPA